MSPMECLIQPSKRWGTFTTKFINCCTVTGFGDFTVQKEIVDSTLILCGRCQVISGTVMATTLNCRRGIEAKHIGTMASKSSHLIVGTDDMIDLFEERLEIKFKKIREQLKKLKKSNNLLSEKEELLFNRHLQKCCISGQRPSGNGEAETNCAESR